MQLRTPYRTRLFSVVTVFDAVSAAILPVWVDFTSLKGTVPMQFLFCARLAWSGLVLSYTTALCILSAVASEYWLQLTAAQTSVKFTFSSYC